MVQDEQEKWDIVIKPRSGLFRLDLEEVGCIGICW